MLVSSFRRAAEKPKADLVWSYYRFKLLVEYHMRSILPFPFNIIGNIVTIFKSCTSNKDHHVKEVKV